MRLVLVEVNKPSKDKAMILIRRILNEAAISRTNKERLAIWKKRWKETTGGEATTAEYQVAHCRTCNKPHWYSGKHGKYLTARCPGH